MKNIISRSALLVSLLLFAVSSISQADSSLSTSLRPIQDIHSELLRKFTPVDQPDGDLGVNHSGDWPFTGDCDDYYTAAFNQLYRFGYAPYAQLMAVRATGKGHIVACVDIDGRAECLDHNRNRTSSIRDLKRLYHVKERRNVVGI